MRNIRDELPEVPYGVLSGPNLAKKLWQVCYREQSLQSESELVRYAVQHALHSALFPCFW